MLAADDEIGFPAVREMAVPGVEIALVVQHARAATAELAVVDGVVVVVEGEQAQAVPQFSNRQL